MPLLLAVSEIGGYQNLRPLYESLAYEVVLETKMRKALKWLKKNTPDVVVAEFNYQSDFRDRTSSLESLMSVIQRHKGIKVIIFYDKEHKAQLEKLEARFDVADTMSFPIEEDVLREYLKL